jgi:dTDP-4-amino-4,6-dideoxygalactose transaminase
MIRLRDEQWERIRDHFPEEKIADGRPGRKPIPTRCVLEALEGLPLECPQTRHQEHVWHLYVVRTPRRDALRAHLYQAGIETGLHYPIPCHRQPCLAHLDIDSTSFPSSDRWASEGLSLPLYTGISEAQITYVVSHIRAFFGKA